MRLAGDRYLLRTNPDGSRQISWRMWVLIWVLPVVMALGALVMAAWAQYLRESYVETQGTVTHVYAWENDAPQIFYPGEKIYSPRFRYTWSDGTETEATTGSSHTGWNFEIGSSHTIRYDPSHKDDVVLAGPSEWWVATYVGWIAAVCLIPALIGTALVLRWQVRGKQAT